MKNISFEINPGQKVALVGPSGAGKTTITHLLLRFIREKSGQIIVGDNNLNGIKTEAWRSQISWVPQNPYLFHASIAENIRLGKLSASDSEVIGAANMANLDDFIATLPQGYDTIVGERGARISGGQAQRVALARAFLKNAPFIILDEPTSNLDPKVESAIQKAIERLTESATVLVIAHRLSTIQGADKILVITEGQIQESGTHRTLVKQNGLYSRMISVDRGEA